MNKYLDNRLRAKQAVIAFFIMLIICIALLISDLLEFQSFMKGWMTQTESDANTQRQMMILTVSSLVQIFLIVLFLMWFRRAYHNLHKAGEKGLTASEGWSVGYWFIPVANLFMPFQIMNDIWNRTKTYGSKNSEEFDPKIIDETNQELNEGEGMNIVSMWWACWIISSLSGTVGWQMMKSAKEIGDFQFASLINILSDLTGIVAIFLAILMILKSQEHQNEFLIAVRSRDQEVNGISQSDDILD